MGRIVGVIAMIVLGAGVFVTRYALIDAVREVWRGKRYSCEQAQRSEPGQTLPDAPRRLWCGRVVTATV